jgi:hypothetical protein
LTRTPKRRARTRRMMTKRTGLEAPNSRTSERPSMLSLVENPASLPDKPKSSHSVRSCQSSQRYHDPFSDRRSPPHSRGMISGLAFQSQENSRLCWIQW